MEEQVIEARYIKKSVLAALLSSLFAQGYTVEVDSPSFAPTRSIKSSTTDADRWMDR
jgi:hypothetical protein